MSLKVASARATRVEAWLYSEPEGEAKLTTLLTADGDVFSARVSRFELEAAGLDPDVIYYGYRAWGPNWPHEVDWEPGSSRGLREDVDSDGNRFNPNKLLVDPYALEHSHDPGREMARFRDTIRRHINKEGVENATPRELVARLGGSPDHFGDDGRSPAQSVNFVVAHDGFTLADLFACNDKQNNQDWPFGPSPGGSEDNISWDHGGDLLAQREAARTAMALLFVASGVPMITGGDEHLRTQRCNNNMFNLDNEANWLDWDRAASAEAAAFTDFFRALTSLRAEHPALRPTAYHTQRDNDGNGLADAAWLTDLGAAADDAYLDDAGRRFVGLLLDGSESGDSAAAIYVGYNGATIPVIATLPPPPSGSWELRFDTSGAREATGNSGLSESVGGTYAVAPRSLIIAVAR